MSNGKPGRLILAKDGTFDAVDFPLVLWISDDEVKLVTERGTWRLKDEIHSDKTARRKLSVDFSESRCGIGLDLIRGPDNSMEFFEIDDLDLWDGYTYQKQADPE